MSIVHFDFLSRQGVSIPAASPVTVASKIWAHVGSGTLRELAVKIDLDHTYTSDLVLSLTDPKGTRVQLVNRQGGGGDHFRGTTFDDSASTRIQDGTPPFRGVFRPEEKLAAFRGTNPNGEWTLTLEDKAARDGGHLDLWALSMNVETATVQFDMGVYQTKQRQLRAVRAAQRAMRYLKCVQANGGFGSVEAMVGCMGLSLPTPPAPPALDGASAETSILEELLLQMEEAERDRVGAALLASQDRYLGVLMDELEQLRRDSP